MKKKEEELFVLSLFLFSFFAERQKESLCNVKTTAMIRKRKKRKRQEREKAERKKESNSLAFLFRCCCSFWCVHSLFAFFDIGIGKRAAADSRTKRAFILGARKKEITKQSGSSEIEKTRKQNEKSKKKSNLRVRTLKGLSTLLRTPTRCSRAQQGVYSVPTAPERALFQQ